MSPPRTSLSDVARLVGRSVRDLQSLARTAPRRYQQRVREDGRPLNVPDDELKAVQRAIHQHVLRRLPVNPCVHSAPGRSILTNARLHARHPYLSTFDVEQCFPSVSPYRVAAGLTRAGFATNASWLITRLATVSNQLPQGAPTSPPLLNVVLVDLDGKLASVARGAGLTFTRYVDDLYLSGGERTVALARVVERVLRDHQLRIKPSKRFDWGPHERHSVTKIVVNTKPNPLPEYLASLSRILEDHQSGARPLDAEEMASVRGKVAYVRWLNPDVGRRLEHRFSATCAARPAHNRRANGA